MTTKAKSYGGLAILTAIAASLCCITPVLAFVAGLGGLASSFSWLEPFRPYLIGTTVAVLAFAWYQKLKPSRDIDCNCEGEETPFLQTNAFLTIVTLFAILMLTFPYYSHNFYPDTQISQIEEYPQGNLKTVEFSISGMTCMGCEQHIINAVNELSGIQSVEANYGRGNATVQYINTSTSQGEIIKAINSTGYKVTN